MIEALCYSQLELEIELSSLAEINPWLDSIWEKCTLPDDRRFDISVCVYEAVANVIMYAFDQPQEHLVMIALEARGDLIEITVEDDGRPFNPLDYPEPNLPTSILEAAIGGHGISLIRSLSDRVFYTRVMKRNRLTIINKLS